MPSANPRMKFITVSRSERIKERVVTGPATTYSYSFAYGSPDLHERVHRDGALSVRMHHHRVNIQSDDLVSQTHG